MEEFRKIFLQVQKGNVKRYIRIFSKPHQKPNLCHINELIKIAFDMDQAPTYMTESGVELEPDDVVDYITQFIGNPSFILRVKNAGFIPADSSKGTESNSGTDGDSPYKQLQQDLDSSSKVMIDHLLNNLETKADVQSFLRTQCPSTMQFYYNKQSLAASDRINISKHIIRQLLSINPNRMLQRSDFEKLAGFIVDIFSDEAADTYYRKYSNGKIASGKLYDAYTNQRKKLAKNGLIIRRPRKRENK
ncbi:unnamed protein product [Hermetia illucens]|uniref:Uncharacterized protein n=1 Tax=Hermetia illucens TaxID=343691 RepID=A0A7R8UG40_HERIL|nr:uncharacterized protein LOC119646746 [Hermetia illucens]CAD7080222.1 unnamed protein product [Hermetia illucens]